MKKIFYLGFNLIEMMFVQVLSLIILSLVFKHYAHARLQADANSNYLQSIYNAELAMKMLGDEIALSGYIGCMKLTDVLQLNHNQLSSLNRLEAVNDHELIVRHADIKHADVIDYDPNQKILRTNLHHLFAANDVVILSDCAHAEMLQIKNVKLKNQNQIIYFTTLPHFFYRTRATLAPFLENHFFLRKTRYHFQDKSTLVALYVHNATGDHWLADIEKINFNYTLSKEGSVSDVKALEVDDWRHVIGVTIALKTHFLPAFWYRYVALQS